MTNPITAPLEPSPWHARQAAMLYHYSSLDYLKGLHQLVTQMITGVVDPLLTLADSQGRDDVLTSARWGTRDTSDNWANNAWPFLKDMQSSLAKQVAMRAFDKFQQTYVNSKLRGADQSSTQWMSIEEEERYNDFAAMLSAYAHPIDMTLYERPEPRWNDYRFAYRFLDFASSSPRIPKFRIRSDLAGESGDAPPRTGVYISATDPHAALQFATAGPAGIRLKNATTFNALGLAALAAVGRSDLWFDEAKMLAFALGSKQAAIVDDLLSDGVPDPSLAPSAVGSEAFTEMPSTWHFVEIVPDQFEDVRLAAAPTSPRDNTRRVLGGESCPSTGYYFSPAHPQSRGLFQLGQSMPSFNSGYGQTVWQWDANQSTGTG